MDFFSFATGAVKRVHLQENMKYSIFRHLLTQCVPPGAIQDMKEALICFSHSVRDYNIQFHLRMSLHQIRSHQEGVCMYVCACAFMYYFSIYDVNVVNVAYHCA